METENQEDSFMFNITEERNTELLALATPIFTKYGNSEITNCQAMMETLKLDISQDEKYYLAYQLGVYVEQQSRW